MQPKLEKYFRMDKLPHIWCPGCGHGIILGSIVRAINNIGLDQDNICIVSGIGCSSRAPGYMNFDTLHTTHGRALAFATGIKLSKPTLKVIVITGDGDCAAIGGNHLIHAARRNIDLTTIVFNNNIYGMTNGQYSPMTPKDAFASTAPYGNIDRSFDLCELAIAAGATFVGRGTAYHTNQLIKLIEGALTHNGFSLIDAISACPTYYGRKNKLDNSVDMLLWQRDHAVNFKAAKKLPSSKLKNKFFIGKLHESNEPEYTTEYDQLIKNVRDNLRSNKEGV